MTISEGKVLLVVPPFNSVTMPNLGVSQLKSNLENAGYTTEVLYLNFDFARRIDLDKAEWISQRTFSTLLGEFIFSTALFQQDPSVVERYVEEIVKTRPGIELFGDQSPQVLIEKWCREARDFCDGEGLERILSSGASVVGFSSSFQQNCAALALLTRLKRRRPDIVTVMGGANCSGEMGQELLHQFAEIDFIGDGECDHALVSLVERLDEGVDTHDIPGIVSRHPLQLAQPSMSLTGADLDALPYPDLDDYFEQFAAHGFEQHYQPLLAMETARGCWWGAKHHCTFCGLNQDGMHFRSKSPERALAEIDWLVDRYGPRHIAAADNILDMQYFKTVLPRLAETGRTTLFYETKANLNREQVRLLAEARINGIQPGIESLSSKSLKLMQKGCSKEQNVQLLKWCSEYGVRVAWNYLIGFPGEDESEFDTITDETELLHHLEPPRGYGVLRIDRFSPYFNDPEKYGLAPIRPATAYQHVYPFADEAVGHIAYFYESDLLADKEKGPGVSTIESMVSRWHQAFNRSFLIEVSRGDKLILIDTRKCARRWIHRLEGLERAVYRHCDSAHSLDNIVRAMSERAGADAVTAAIESLVSKKLLLAADRRYVSLGVTPDRRLTFENATAMKMIRSKSSRRERLVHDLRLLARMLVEPGKIAPRAVLRLRNAWRRRHTRLLRRTVLLAANFYSDTAVKNI